MMDPMDVLAAARSTCYPLGSTFLYFLSIALANKMANMAHQQNQDSKTVAVLILLFTTAIPTYIFLNLYYLYYGNYMKLSKNHNFLNTNVA